MGLSAGLVENKNPPPPALDPRTVQQVAVPTVLRYTEMKRDNKISSYILNQVVYK